MLLAILAGVLAGTFTGLTPGIHINLVSAAVLSLSPALLRYATPLALAAFIVAMSVTHTFLDSIPSIFLGAPDGATALGVLPGHRLLLKGQGLLAVELTLVGSLGATIASVLFFPLFVKIIQWAYPFMKAMMGWLLLAVAAFMVFRDRKPIWAFVVFSLAGFLGLATLAAPLRNPLFPMLSGLFGVATLLYSLTTTTSLPRQEAHDIELPVRLGAKALASGQASGFLTAMLPGLGAATAAVLSLQFTRGLGDDGYLVLQGSIGTVNFILSLATLVVLGKARNGSLVAVQKLVNVGVHHALLLLAAALLAAGCAALLAVLCGRVFARVVPRIPYRALIVSIIAFIVVLTPVLSDWPGLVVLVTATAVGLIPAIVKTARVHAMACLLVPVMTYFL
ncbi:hypothetical protein D6789_00340 [Candidatus Woesearchaeota archaeon]|nr:MAG: hypothetical protein D6789_00340 [Candidatus Woesearchaeota archaeon]